MQRKDLLKAGIGVGAMAAVLGPQAADAATSNVTVLSTIEVGPGGASAISLSGISQSYTNLRVVIQAGTSATSDQLLRMRYNSLSGSDYLWAYNVNAAGTLTSGASSGLDTSAVVGIIPAVGTSDLAGTVTVDIAGYSLGNFQAGYVSSSGAYGSDGVTVVQAGGLLGGGANTVTSLTFLVGTGVIVAGSVFQLQAA